MSNRTGSLLRQVCIACLALYPARVMPADALKDLLSGTPGLPPVLAVAAMRTDVSGYPQSETAAWQRGGGVNSGVCDPHENR